MKKIYSIYERLVSIFTILLLSIIAVILFIKYNSYIILVYICILFIIVALLKLFSVPSHIVIRDNRIKVFDFPLLATNKFYDKKESLISYNSEINIDVVEKIEIITLTREEQLKYIGYKHLSRKYLKFNLKYGGSKYVYVGNYSNYQIKKIIEIVNKKILDLDKIKI